MLNTNYCWFCECLQRRWFARNPMHMLARISLLASRADSKMIIDSLNGLNLIRCTHPLQIKKAQRPWFCTFLFFFYNFNVDIKCQQFPFKLMVYNSFSLEETEHSSHFLSLHLLIYYFFMNKMHWISSQNIVIKTLNITDTYTQFIIIIWTRWIPAQARVKTLLFNI